MSILHLTLCTALVAVASAQSPSDCWYTDPPAVCDSNVEDTQLPIDSNSVDYDTFEEQMTWCQEQCVAQDGQSPPLPKCNFFTVRPGGRGAVLCFLMETCTMSTTDECLLETDLCGGGQGDCAVDTGCAPLTKYETADDDKIRWDCEGVTNPYDPTVEIALGSDCHLSCDGWFDDLGNTVNVISTCETGGVFSASVIKGKWDGSTSDVEQTSVPALNGKTLPKPDDASTDQISCGCGPLPMAWDGTINYNPDVLPGTTFICENGNYIVDDPDNAGQSAFIIEEDMTCRLYCDGYHVATMECLNGDWTGQPELGAWCYYAPTSDDEMGVFPYVPPTL